MSSWPSRYRRAVPRWVSESVYSPVTGTVRLPLQRTEMSKLNFIGVSSEDAFMKLYRPRLRFTCRSVRTSCGSPSKRVFVQYSACSPRTCRSEPTGVKTEDGNRGGPGSKSAGVIGSIPSAYSTRTLSPLPSPTRLRMPSSILTTYVGLTKELPLPVM